MTAPHIFMIMFFFLQAFGIHSPSLVDVYCCISIVTVNKNRTKTWRVRCACHWFGCVSKSWWRKKETTMCKNISTKCEKHAWNMIHYQAQTTLIMLEFSVIMSEFGWWWLQMVRLLLLLLMLMFLIARFVLIYYWLMKMFCRLITRSHTYSSRARCFSNFVCQYWLVMYACPPACSLTCLRALTFKYALVWYKFFERWSKTKKIGISHKLNEYKTLSFIHF